MKTEEEVKQEIELVRLLLSKNIDNRLSPGYEFNKAYIDNKFVELKTKEEALNWVLK